MNLRLFFRTMWRESRGAKGRLFFFGACLTVGVAAVVGIAALVDAMELGIRARSRELLGGDLAVDSRRPLPDLTPLLPVTYRNLPRAELRILSSMVRTEAGTSHLAELKAVATEHGSYPLTGSLRLSPNRPLSELLRDDSVLVAPALRDALKLKLGDQLIVGGQSMRVAGIILQEPDPLGFSFSFGPRLLMTRAALDKTNLLGFGSRSRFRTLLAFPAATSEAELARVVRILESRIPGAGTYVKVESHREAQPALRNTLEKVQQYLGLVALLSLLVASVGVSQIVASWLAQAAPQTAILRCLGFRPRDVFAMYLGHVLLLALLGSVLGACLGVCVPLLISRSQPEVVPASALQLALIWPALRGVLLGVGSALLFSLPPLTAVWKVAPAGVLRAEANPLPVPRRVRLLAYCLAALGLFGAALLQSKAWLPALGFAGGVSALAGLLWLGARGLTWAVARLPRQKLSPLLWHGAAALGRPSAGATGSIVALGMGTLVVLSIVLIQGTMGHEIAGALPRDAPSVFMLDIQPDQWPGVERLCQSVGARRIDSVPVVMGRLLAVDGRSVAQLMKERDIAPNQRGREQWALSREQRITFMKQLPKDNKILEGRLWSDPKRPELSLERGFARELGASVGSTLRLDVQGVELEFLVSSLRSVEWRSFGINFFMVAEPGTLDDAPQIRLAAAQVDARFEQTLQDELATLYPNVTVLRVREMLQQAAGILAQVALAVRLLGSFAVITGLIILIGAVASTQLRRAREAALLKTLGQTRMRVAAMFSIEYALSGAVSGLLGAAGAYALAATFTHQVLKLQSWPAWQACVLAVLASIVLSVLGGLLASARALRVRPLEVLRGRR